MHCTKEWKLKQNTDDKKSLLERLLEIRGITSDEMKTEFLNPKDITLMHPNAFCDMQKAVELTSDAINKKENILIYGDFDADGVTSTSVLFKTIKYLGGNVIYYIPNRDTEGHGLNNKVLAKMLSQQKVQLIITVDNGISNIDEVNFVKSFGRKVIITDHHEAAEKVPNADAIINPKAMNALDEKLTAKQIECMTSLAGVGVAFKFAQGILEKFNKLEYSYELLPYVAVGTIADLVPLIGENRYFVVKGLELISQGKHYGLKRMLDVAGINYENGLTSEQVAFTIAPRINASGRIDTVDAALKVMVSDNKQEVEMAIITLENYNKLRQELCSEIFAEADEMWQATGMRDNAIVLFKKDWHVGVVGIVASKFVEKYYKPTFIMTYSEETNQVRCSARGVKELNIYDIMSSISEYFEGFGGHQLAGGFSFSCAKTDFETVKKAINSVVDEMLNGERLVPSLDIDLELGLDSINTSLIDEISKLEPFGMSNPSPTFVLKEIPLKQKKLMGSRKEHLKLLIETPTGLKDCIWWSRGDLPLVAGDKMDIAFAPQLNVFNGTTDIQLLIKDVHSDALNVEETSSIKIYDHRKKKNILAQVNDYIKNTKLGVSVFVEDRNIAELLKPYPEITQKIVNRNSANKNDVLMFFDYPADEETYIALKQKTCPSAIHYMSYQNFTFDAGNLFKIFSGMIKYTCNNLDGKFSLNRAAAALGITEEAVEVLLEIFKDTKMLNIKSYDENGCIISFEHGIELSKLFECPKYSEFIELMNTINQYKNSFMTSDLC